jgi:hypothetical protein
MVKSNKFISNLFLYYFKILNFIWNSILESRNNSNHKIKTFKNAESEIKSFIVF